MKMKFGYIIVISVLLVVGCKKTITESLPSLSKDEISGERLWQRITVDEDYKTYPFWPGHEGLQMGQSPHGRYNSVYVTPEVIAALPIESKTAPYGTIIVKENYSADKEFAMFTLMAKIEGYDPENGDWFWAKYDPEGNVLAEGQLQGCINCHVSSNNDYLFFWQLDRAE